MDDLKGQHPKLGLGVTSVVLHFRQKPNVDV